MDGLFYKITFKTIPNQINETLSWPNYLLSIRYQTPGKVDAYTLTRTRRSIHLFDLEIYTIYIYICVCMCVMFKWETKSTTVLPHEQMSWSTLLVHSHPSIYVHIFLLLPTIYHKKLIWSFLGPYFMIKQNIKMGPREYHLPIFLTNNFG